MVAVIQRMLRELEGDSIPQGARACGGPRLITYDYIPSVTSEEHIRRSVEEAVGREAPPDADSFVLGSSTKAPIPYSYSDKVTQAVQFYRTRP